MPQNPELANLKRIRIYTHKQIDKLQPQLDRLTTRLAEVEARIQEIAPELRLSPRRYKPNPIFARGEFTRMVLEVLRDANGPMSMRAIAMRMLAFKGHMIPDRQTRERTFYRASTTLSVLHGRGEVEKLGKGRDFTWKLTGQA